MENLISFLANSFKSHSSSDLIKLTDEATYKNQITTFAKIYSLLSKKIGKKNYGLLYLQRNSRRPPAFCNPEAELNKIRKILKHELVCLSEVKQTAYCRALTLPK